MSLGLGMSFEVGVGLGDRIRIQSAIGFGFGFRLHFGFVIECWDSGFRNAATFSSGANPQTERAASRSHSYLCWKKSPSRLRSHEMHTLPPSMSSARPFSSGSAIIVSLELRVGMHMGGCEGGI